MSDSCVQMLSIRRYSRLVTSLYRTNGTQISLMCPVFEMSIYFAQLRTNGKKGVELAITRSCGSYCTL